MPVTISTNTTIVIIISSHSGWGFRATDSPLGLELGTAGVEGGIYSRARESEADMIITTG